MPENAPNAMPQALNGLMEELCRLPGIGRRSAERIAFFLLKSSKSEALALAEAIAQVKKSIRNCRICYNLTQTEVCPICSDARRDHGRILVVEHPKDVISLEQTGMYRGGYHVLMGRLSPLEGVGHEDITVAELMRRIDDPKRNAGESPVVEVIFGLSPNLEGDGTVLYLSELLAGRGVTLSRLARGLPAGSQLEFASRAVLADAIVGRQSLQPSPSGQTGRSAQTASPSAGE